MDAKLCLHCKAELVTEHELFIHCCLLCRRYALLRGTWPEGTQEKNMSVELTNEQVARVLEICERIASIKNEVPLPPRGFEMSLEIAKYLRTSLLAQNSMLVELSALLR